MGSIENNFKITLAQGSFKPISYGVRLHDFLMFFLGKRTVGIIGILGFTQDHFGSG